MKALCRFLAKILILYFESLHLPSIYLKRQILPRLINSFPSSTKSDVISLSPMNCWKPSRFKQRVPKLIKQISKRKKSIIPHCKHADKPFLVLSPSKKPMFYFQLPQEVNRVTSVSKKYLLPFLRSLFTCPGLHGLGYATHADFLRKQTKLGHEHTFRKLLYQDAKPQL